MAMKYLVLVDDGVLVVVVVLGVDGGGGRGVDLTGCDRDASPQSQPL